MAGIIEQYTNSKLSDDDKLLKGAGLIASDGGISSLGWELLKEILFDENKGKIVKVVKELNLKESDQDEEEDD